MLLLWSSISLSAGQQSVYATDGELLYTEGLQLLQQGLYPEASQVLERAIALSAEPERLFALGVTYYRLHRPAQAYQVYQQALSVLPEAGLAARIRSGLGDVYFAMDDYSRAAEAYRQALDFQPGWSGVRLKLATSYLRLERYNEALNESETLLKSQDPLIEAYYLRSLIYLGRHQWEAATVELEALANRQPQRFETYQQRNWLYRLQRRYPEAVKVADEATTLYRTLPEAYQLATVTRLDKMTQCLVTPNCKTQADAELAHQHLERWLLLSPEQPQVYYELGRLEQLTDDRLAAQAAYEQAYLRFPARTDYLLKLAESDWVLNQRAQARKWLKDLVVPEAGSPLWRELAKWHNQDPALLRNWMTQLENVPPNLNQLLTKPPQDDLAFWLSYLNWLLPDGANQPALRPETQTLQALKLWRAGEKRWAKQLLLQAHQQAPEWWLPCELLGRIGLETGSIDALNWLSAAYAQHPGSQALALRLAEHLPSGPERRKHLELALQTFPESTRLQELYLNDMHQP